MQKTYDIVPSYREVTKQMLDKHNDANILLLAPDCNLGLQHIEGEYYKDMHNNLIAIPDGDFFVWLDKYKKRVEREPFDVCIALRVLEHIPLRQLDYLIYCLSCVIKSSGRLYIVVPDMTKCIELLLQELRADTVDWFNVLRLNIEIFSEGDHVYDRHATFTSEELMRYILTKEGLFVIESITPIKLDTVITPELYIVATRV